MSLGEIFFLLVILLSNIIQTITGFAGTVLAMPPSIRLVGEDVCKPVLNLVAIIVCAYVVIMHFKDINWKEFLWMILFVGVGFGIGTALSYLPHDSRIFLIIYGSVIMAIAVVFFFLNTDKVKIPDWILYILLVFGGILHALYVSGGPLVIIFATYKIKEKNQFRATLSMMWIILNSILFTEHMIQGRFTPQVWMLFGIGAGLSILSMFVGHLIAKKLNLKIFMKITYVLLFISGLSLLF
ncbi:MAG: sulfite exporter TauE/SafE family protein [Bacilli bacterium]|jgi:uncharacterized membrane protein YfcA|nr:sulfite exporter TauE/SafE family protein [Bacilli bacterium]